MTDDVSFKKMLDQSLDTQDPFIAAACHPYANPHERRALESVLFATTKLRRQFARAMYTPTSVLDSLAADNDKQIRLRVAKHPTATPATLATLARTETAEVVCARIAGHRNSPQDTLVHLFKKHPNSFEIKRALCNNPNTPQSLLQRLVVGAPLTELKGIARNPHADDTLLRLCWEQNDPYLQAEVCAHPNCALELRAAAERAPHALVRRKLAQNPVLPDAVLMRLLGDTEAQVRAAAVRHLSESMMAELDSGGYDSSRQVRRDEARHTGLPLAWVMRLARDTDSWVRRLIARNQTTPEHILHSLAHDAVMEVRRGVARNPVCPTKLLQQLARDSHPWVRAGIALRDDIDEPLILELSRDDDIDVLSALGKHPRTPQKILERITRHVDRDVRRSVVLNTSAPPGVLHGLLEDPYPLNRVLLAGHRNLADADLYGLLHDPEPTVRFAGARALAARLH